MSFGLTVEQQRTLVTKASDEAFVKKLQKDPKATLKSLGAKVPDSVTIRVVRDTASVNHIVVPATPIDREAAKRGLRGQVSGSEAEAAERGMTLLWKAQQDKGFRAQLVKEPRSVLERELKAKFPAGVQMKVLEDTGETVHLLLPPERPAKVEISDEELEAVAGGSTAACATSIVGTIIFSVATAVTTSTPGIRRSM